MTSTQTPQRIDFFIAGSERSGTTLTGTLLDQMPEICALQATMVMTRLSNLYTMIREVQKQGGSFDDIDPAVCGSLSEFVENVAVTPFLHKCLLHVCFYENLMNSARADVTKDVLAQKAYVESFDFNRYMDRFCEENPTWASSVSALYAEFAASGQSKGHIFGEQTPDNALRSKAILKLFPSAKLIFVVRHPVTCVASLMDRYPDLEYAVRQYRNPFAHYPFDNEAIMDRTLFVKFEDIMLNRDLALNSVRDFLGLKPLKGKQKITTHSSRMFSKYVGDSVSSDRYFRSLAGVPTDLRRDILKRNSDIADVFYSKGESEGIIGYKAAA